METSQNRRAIALLVSAAIIVSLSGQTALAKSHRSRWRDVVPPAASITAPTAGATVAGPITVTGTASDNLDVARVDVSVDGGTVQTATGTTDWSFGLDTSSLSNASHTIIATAIDASGNTASASETVTVSNPVPDTTHPTVSISSPSAGATVSGSISVTGAASDNVSVAKVEASVDGGAYQPATGTTSWSFGLDTTALSNASHTITARATDGAGNTATSAVTVTVSNTSGSGSHMVTPEGVTIDVASDVTGWTAQQIYDILKPNAYQLGLIGPNLTIKVQTLYPSSTSTSASSSGGVYKSFRATIYLKATAGQVFTAKPDYVIAHEYGHAWTLYHYYLTQQKNWTPYWTERGLLGDPRLESTYNWTTTEMIADDYRMLFGTATAQNQAAYINPDIPDPRTVPGLKNWFQTVWAAGT